MPERPVRTVIDKKSFVTAPMDLPVAEAARLMKKHHLGAVLIVDDGRLAGICTERDITFQVVAAGLDPAATPVGKIMTRDPQTISAEKPFRHALHLMFEGGFRHVPVVDEGKQPIGLVAAHDALGLDVIQFEQDLILREGLSEVM